MSTSIYPFVHLSTMSTVHSIIIRVLYIVKNIKEMV